MSEDQTRADTLLAEAGRRREWTDSIVNPPVYRASTVLFDSVAELEDSYPPRDGVPSYGRNGLPTAWALAEALTALEPGAAGTMLYPSGMAAVAVALLSVLKPGDELLMVDSAYAPTRAYCDRTLKRLGIGTRYYDPLIGAGIAGLIGEKTRAVFMESPGSMTFEVQDVPAIAAAAKERGLVTLLDNTWATPLFFAAIEKGIDLSILACTKYIVGHSDAMLGSVTAAPELLKTLERTSRDLGQCAGPDDVWLGLRGLRTLSVRLERHQKNALEMARWLAAREEVARVLHPALPQCPGHEHWRRDYGGASGLFAIVMEGGGEAAVATMIDGLDHFGIGYSWGGYESLAVPAKAPRTASERDREGPAVRLHVGLEDPADLIADLERGLARYRKER